MYRNALRLRNFNLGIAAVAYMRRVVENRMNDMLEILHDAKVLVHYLDKLFVQFSDGGYEIRHFVRKLDGNIPGPVYSSTMKGDSRFLTYLGAWFGDWLTGMSGSLAVPFAALAVWRPSASAKVLWTCLALLSFIVASYRVWRNERIKAETEAEEIRNECGETVNALTAEISELKHRPYEDELARQASALIEKLSPDGRTLLRHLVIHERIELGKQMLPSIPQSTQDTQMGMCFDSKIIFINIERSGPGNIVGQNYSITPEFVPVLKDLLFKDGLKAN